MAGLFDDLIPQGGGARVPASIRNNNPGAQWPGPSAQRYGATGFETLNDGQGNKIARFDTPEAGAAAQFDLLRRNYAGMPLNEAIRKWSGGNSSDAYTTNVARAIGMQPTDVLSPDILSDPARAIPFAQAMARIEAGRDFPMSDEQWAKAHQMAFAGPSGPSASPGVSAINSATAPRHNATQAQAGGMFDDLIPAQAPQQPQAAGTGPSGRPTFDVPYQAPPQPEQPRQTPAPTALSSANEGVLRGLTFGFGDEIMAGALTPIEMAVRAAQGQDWSPGASYNAALDRERGIQNEATDQFPVASTIGDIAGSLVAGGGLAKGGTTLLNVTNPTVAGMAGRAAAEGAAYGAARGAGEGEGALGRLEGAGAGAGVGALTGGALGAWAGRSASKAAKSLLPKIEDLKAAGAAAYKAADDAGLVLTPQSLQRLGGDMAAAMRDFGFNPRLHPGGQAIIEEISALSSAPSSLKDLEIVRRIAGQAARSTDPSTRELATRMIDKIDDFLAGLKPSDVVMGDRVGGVRALTEARKYWGQYRRLDQVERAMMKAEDRAASTGAGGNYENAVRQNIRAILDKGAKGFSEEEKAAMRRVVRGGSIENVARLIGKLAPTGVVSGALSGGAGAAIAGGPGAVALPVLGFGGKKLAETMANRNVQNLMDIIRSGGKLPPISALKPAQVQAIDALLSALAQEEASFLSTAPASTAP